MLRTIDNFDAEQHTNPLWKPRRLLGPIQNRGRGILNLGWGKDGDYREAFGTTKSVKWGRWKAGKAE